MIILIRKWIVELTITALILTLLAGCSSLSAPMASNTKDSASQNTNIAQKQNEDVTISSDNQDAAKSNSPLPSAIPQKSETNHSIIYENTQYGFNFILPESWNGYTIVTDKWEGLTIGNSQGEAVAETGPIISIRHPLWTSKTPRQDIPIMIFTLTQWDLLRQEKFHIGAAPFGPSELGRNSSYVFALPARYNYAFPAGFEEMEKILDSNPLKPK